MDHFKRTSGCGTIDSSYLNKNIDLVGWVDTRRDHGGLIFVDLRDRSGLMQIVFNSEFSVDAHNDAHALRSEFVIGVTGKVVERTLETVNRDLPTGAFEIQVQNLIIYNKAKTLPFMLDEADGVDEELRLKYRYLDLRRKAMQDKMKLRHDLAFAMREFLVNENFYEIETPLLTKNTAEGAREFLVPSRLQKSHFYALPQSPQIYKEILMAAGFERYFQIARCFRDEDVRADRQPEFSQLDLELSFVQERDVQDIMERMFAHIFKKIKGVDLKLPFARMAYDEAFNYYGSDKPDLRFNLKINNFTSLFEFTDLSFIKAILSKGGKIGGVVIDDYSFTRSELDGMVDRMTKEGAKGLLWIRFTENGVESPVAKFLPDDFFTQVKHLYPQIKVGSTMFLIAGQYTKAWTLLGRLRLILADKLNMISDEEINLCWITDFPLFEYDEDSKRWQSVHHPFTAAQDGWQELDPGEIKARAYDIVLNGVELGGGSIRIHDSKTQKKMFEFLGFDFEQVQKEFGFLLEAQELGFPPLGGIALGLDRFAMLLSSAQSIREVIAFPKTQSGIDPLMEAPTRVSAKKLIDYGIKLIEKE